MNRPSRSYNSPAGALSDRWRTALPPCHSRDDVDLGEVGHVPPLVPDGVYEFVFVRAERGRFEKRERTFLWFRIATPGDHLGLELYLACPHPSDGGRKFGLGSKLVAAATVALGQRPKRRDRLSTKIFRNKVFRARTRTVTKDSKGNERPRTDQYSTLDTLLSAETGVQP